MLTSEKGPGYEGTVVRGMRVLLCFTCTELAPVLSTALHCARRTHSLTGAVREALAGPHLFAAGEARLFIGDPYVSPQGDGGGNTPGPVLCSCRVRDPGAWAADASSVTSLVPATGTDTQTQTTPPDRHSRSSQGHGVT